MELPTFISLLASLPILFPLVAPSELPPPAPSILVMPSKARFLIGDTVSIACAAPGPAGPDRIRTFRFTKASGSVTDVSTSKRSFVRTFNVSGPQDGGTLTCSYTVIRRDGGHVSSLPSQAVFIHVQDRPAQPNLTVTPSPLTVEGQPLLLTCATPPGHAQRRFRFFRDEREVAEGSGSGARLRAESGGNFSCGYEEMEEGRWILSYPSQAVRVSVEAPCPAPVLSVDPPSGVVAVGHRLRLTCATPPRHFRQRFRFFRNGAEVTPGDGDVIGDVTGATGNGSQLLFPTISQEFSGNFSCRVEEEVGGAWLEAPPSLGVAVVVRAPPPQPILLLTPPSASPNGSESRISLTCLVPAPSGPARRRFLFYRDGSEPTASARPQIWVGVSPSGAGRFRCRYEEELESGWAQSLPSDAVGIPAEFSLLPLVIGGAVGVASLLLALLLAAWLCRRKRGGSRWRGLSPGDDTGTLPMGDLEVAA